MDNIYQSEETINSGPFTYSRVSSIHPTLTDASLSGMRDPVVAKDKLIVKSYSSPLLYRSIETNAIPENSSTDAGESSSMGIDDPCSVTETPISFNIETPIALLIDQYDRLISEPADQLQRYCNSIRLIPGLINDETTQDSAIVTVTLLALTALSADYELRLYDHAQRTSLLSAPFDSDSISIYQTVINHLLANHQIRDPSPNSPNATADQLTERTMQLIGKILTEKTIPTKYSQQICYVDRAQCLEALSDRFYQNTRKGLQISFIGEVGDDDLGLYREALSIAIHDTLQSPLFKVDQYGFYQPTSQQSAHAQRYQRLGMVLAASIPQDMSIGPKLSLPSLKAILFLAKRIADSPDGHGLNNFSAQSLFASLAQQAPDQAILLLEHGDQDQPQTHLRNTLHYLQNPEAPDHHKALCAMLKLPLSADKTEIKQQLVKLSLPSTLPELQAELSKLLDAKLTAHAYMASGMAAFKTVTDHCAKLDTEIVYQALCGSHDPHAALKHALTYNFSRHPLEARAHEFMRRFIAQSNDASLTALAMFWCGSHYISPFAELKILPVTGRKITPEYRYNMITANTCFNLLKVPTELLESSEPTTPEGLNDLYQRFEADITQAIKSAPVYNTP